MISEMVKRAAGKLEKRPAVAPKTHMDMVWILAQAISFSYVQILGKWNFLDLPKAILYAIMDKDKKTVAIECGERNDCVQLKDPETLKELYELKKYLTLTMLFSKHRFRAFLFAAEIVKEDVLLRKRRARILKPAFTLIRDKESKCLFVFIRGTRSIKDTLTDAIGAPVSFKHFVCSDDGVLKRDKVISGHGHHGMVAAARWIRDRCSTKLHDELCTYPDFQIKIVGHSLGGGTAALLTYMLREIKEFSSCTCVTFGPAACMSLELAEYGKPFVTSLINGHDMVPTLSASSVHEFVLQGRIKRKKFISSAYNTIIGSHLPFASSAKAIANNALSRGTEVFMKSKQRTQSLISWFGHENPVALSSSKSENLAEASRSLETSYEVAEEIIIPEFSTDEDQGSNSSSEGSDNDDTDEEEEKIISATHKVATPTVSDDEFNQYLKELQLEAQDDTPNVHGAKGKEAATKKGTKEAEMNDEVHDEESVGGGAVGTSDNLDIHRLYPPGRLMHIVPSLSSDNSKSNHNDDAENHVILYETARELYGKLRLSRGMFHDHKSKNYLKVLKQLINLLEKEKCQHGG